MVSWNRDHGEELAVPSRDDMHRTVECRIGIALDEIPLITS